MAKFTTNASSADWCQFERILADKYFSSCGLNILGPLCLWQCFLDRCDTIGQFWQQQKIGEPTLFDKNQPVFWLSFFAYFKIAKYVIISSSIGFFFIEIWPAPIVIRVFARLRVCVIVVPAGWSWKALHTVSCHVAYTNNDCFEKSSFRGCQQTRNISYMKQLWSTSPSGSELQGMAVSSRMFIWSQL